jgi:thioredoxin
VKDILLRSHKAPVVLHFFAEWCSPCRLVGSLLDKLAAEHGGRFVLVRLDIDSVPAIAERFSVRSIPTVLALKDGHVIHSFSGLRTEPEIRSFLGQLPYEPLGDSDLSCEGRGVVRTPCGARENPGSAITTDMVRVFTVFRDGRPFAIDLDRDALIRNHGSDRAFGEDSVKASDERVGIVAGEIHKWWDEPENPGGAKLHWKCPRCGLQQWGDWTIGTRNPCLWYSDCGCIDKWLIRWSEPSGASAAHLETPGPEAGPPTGTAKAGESGATHRNGWKAGRAKAGREDSGCGGRRSCLASNDGPGNYFSSQEILS